MQLGKLESNDLVDAARYVASLPYADNKILPGVELRRIYDCPVWKRGELLAGVGSAYQPRFYDTVYTERYMRVPAENSEGYDDNSPISNPGGIKGNLLLVHGTIQ